MGLGRPETGLDGVRFSAGASNQISLMKWVKMIGPAGKDMLVMWFLILYNGM
ncbi:MAG: hypothetical protein OSJ53_12005 [Kineothrix sp.]|nr:hypothetical protein [Kineothrix sp.]